MKKILLTLVLLIGIVVGLFAQKLTYQAVIRDNNQQLVVNTAVKATVTITFTTGVPYAEEVNGSTNIHGLLSFEFGDETLAGRDWTGATIAVKVVNAATPSTVYVNDEARPVSAVPYALNVNGQSIQNYLTEHNYVDETELDSRHYLTSDSTVITTMQGNIANLTQHTTKSAIRDSVAGQIHDSIADIAAKSHTHGNKDLLDTYNQTNADLADAVAKKHVHDNAAVLAATTAPYTDADSIKLKGIAEGAEVNVQADWNQSTTTADDYIKNKPTIPTVPTNVSAFNNDAGYITSTDVPAQVNADWNATSGTAQILNKPELFSGNYNDLSNKPTIPTVPTNVSDFSNDAGYITSTDVPAQVNADWNATSGTAQILNKPELFSGNYNDLSNKPTIPAAANNATLTIQKNGTSVGTFTADASSDKSINITVPTTTSELTNNSGFITTANVPTNVSQLNNDAGYVSNSNCPTVDLCELYNMMTSLQNTIARQDSVINALNNELHPFVCGTSTVTDYDGNTYNTVQIGQQCWMKQNLKTTHYSDGTSISLGSSTSTTTAYRYNPDDNSSNVATYGYLYNWKAVMRNTSSSSSNPSGVQGICPTGWHVPSDAEWTQLKNYVSSQSQYVCGSNNTYIAKALASTTGWITSSTTCEVGNTPSNNNATGFSAVPAGTYDGYDGSYDNFGYTAYFWSATQGSSYSAYGRYLGYNLAYVRSNSGYDKNNGYSVRCLRDASIGGGDNPSEPAMMSCEQVMECMGDTLGQLNARITSQGETIAAQGAEIETLNGTVTTQGETITAQGNTIDSLAHIVDSLSNLTPGGEPTATFTCGSSKVKDVDNNEYNTVKIGSQCWMAQNLRTSTNAAGAGNIYTPTASEVPGYDVNTYGRLYDWAAVMQGASSSDAVPSGVQGICPTGWHVPSDAEWTQLTTYVKSKSEYQCDGADNIANALSAAIGWSYNTSEGCYAGSISSTINLTGFSAVPAGLYTIRFLDFGHSDYFWSATEYDSNSAYYRKLSSNDAEVSRWDFSKDVGYSVRCLRDASIGGGDNPSEPATMSCEQVMECMGDTLGQLNAKIEAQGAEIETLNGTVTSQGNTIDSLAHLVDSLSNLPHGGNTPATFTCGSSKVKDVDNNEYNTVAIGNQCWLKENLRTKTLQYGQVWTKTDVDSAIYGRYYDWQAAMQIEQGNSTSYTAGDKHRGICPAGWHVPSDAEWTALTDYVKSKSEYQCGGNAANIAKALSQPTGWSNTDTGCNAGNTGDKANATGFSAVPAGLCFYGSFEDFGDDACFWSATQDDDFDAWCRSLYSNASYVVSRSATGEYGFSVRCLRDAGVGGTPGENETGGTTPSAPAMMSCEQVMECMGDTLGRLNAKIEAQGNTIDSLANSVDSLSRLIPDSPGIPTDTFICGTSTVTDHEGNVYNTVQIGDQCWTRENMRCTTSPSTGTNILEFPASSYTYSGKKAYYPNDDASNVATYGLLYNWNAAVDTFNTAYGETSTNTSLSNAVSVTFSGNRRGICPVGWHVPSDAEWTQLTTYVGSQSEYVCGSDNTNIAKALASTTGWSSNSNDYVPGNDPSTNNATGFSAVPAGNYSGSYLAFGNYAYFWSATRSTSNTAYNRTLYYNNANVNSGYHAKYYGYSVRCLRDGGVGGAPATNESGSAGNAGGSPDSGCCTELGARMDSLQNVIDGLQNTVSSQDSVINALNNELHPFVCGTSTVTDHEGNVYNTVQVGDQCWTKENMRCTTSPSTGTSILEYPASSYSYTGKNAYYPNDNASNVATYGLLYNWCAAVDTFNTAYGETSTNTEYSNAPSVTFGGNRRGICPVGWHVPSNAEWDTLTSYVKSQSQYVSEGCTGTDNANSTYCIAKALASTTGWSSNSNDYVPGNDPSTNNATGFSAVPAGVYGGSYGRFGNDAYFWSATQNSSRNAYDRGLDYGTTLVDRYGSSKFLGFSVRCLRD